MTLPPVYVITCSQSDRPAKARAHFYERGIPAHFVQGVHGLTWGLQTEKWTHRNGPGYRIDPGHVGLCLSHWLLWSHLWLSGVEEAVVCEDDCIFQPDFLEQFSAARATLPDDWLLWYVGTVPNAAATRAPVSATVSRYVEGVPFGTHCYALRRAALPTLLETCQEARLHIDLLIAEKALPKLAGRWYVSDLVGQHSSNGTWAHAVGGADVPTPIPEPSPTAAAYPRPVDELAALEKVPGWCCAEKRDAIYDAVRSLGDSFNDFLECVEIGVYGGQSLLPAAMALRDTSRGGIVAGIDPYTAAASLDGLQPEVARQWWGDLDHDAIRAGAEKAIRPYATWCRLVVAMPDDVADGYHGLHYLHVDDSHATATALRNVRTWLPKLLPGGVLVLDDATWESVQPARALIAAECQLIAWDTSPGRRWEIYRRPENA